MLDKNSKYYMWKQIYIFDHILLFTSQNELE
jgi:hypothetical protein